MNAIESELDIQVKEAEVLKGQGLIEMIGEELDAAYNRRVAHCSRKSELAEEIDVSLVFTPLHGTANKSVRRALQSLGYQNVHIVKEQELPIPIFRRSNLQIQRNLQHLKWPLSLEIKSKRTY